MAVTRNWVSDAAHEIALLRDGATVPKIEEVIKRQCPFQQDTAYESVGINRDFERTVIEAAIEFGLNEKKIRQRKAHLGTRLPLMNALEDAADALIAAREKQ